MNQSAFPILPEPEFSPERARFDGADIDPKADNERLTGQIGRIYECMKDGHFRTLNEIALITGEPQTSISAQLRNLRKERFGGYKVERRARGERSDGLYEYNLTIPQTKQKL